MTFQSKKSAFLRLKELEQRLARTENAINRCMELLDREELADMKQLSAKLARLNTEQAQLAKAIEAEKSKAAVVANSPKVLELLRDKVRSGTLSYWDVDSGSLVSEDIILMPNDEKEAIKLMDDELAKIKEYLKDTEERKRIRNLMPTFFEGIRIQFGKKVSASCRFVDGRESVVVIQEQPKPLRR